ncbi:MAG: HAD family hydrolase [Deltaproteobacteria bacterium]|jgi:phosphoglycolate phosphatase|nr:HAD family hydrolase [Deltaproteobacteria bacterium]
MTVQAAIFDLDGTTLNTLPDLAGSLNTALKAKGLPDHTVEEYRPMVGNGMAKMIERALPEDRRDPETQAGVMALFKAEYARRQCDLTVPYEGIPELLRDLKSRSWALGLLSNKDHENTAEIVSHFFPGLFDQVLGVKPGAAPKPDPSGALALCRAFGLKPAQVFYVGDSGVDMNTAKGAGCPALGAAWGFRPEEELRQEGALAILKKPSDFLPVIGSLPHGPI